MVILQKCDKEFERGTTVTSQFRIRDDDDRITPADTLIIDGEQIDTVTISVKDSDEGDFITEAEAMTEETDQNGEVFYSYPFFIPEDADYGEYYAVHRVQVGGEQYKKTIPFDVVELKE